MFLLNCENLRFFFHWLKINDYFLILLDLGEAEVTLREQEVTGKVLP